MNSQLKRGILSICILKEIQNEDTYGYKMLKDLEFLQLSESTLYTILKRLEESKMLEIRLTEHEGRIRKYYHITASGLKRLIEFKEEWKELASVYQYVASH